MIYLDLDGVLANFEGKAEELFGDKWKEEVEANGWGRFTEYQNIYEMLSPMDDALKLYEGCVDIVGNRHLIQVLTALPNRARFDSAAKDKIEWTRKHIHPDLRVVFGPHAQDKQYHVRRHDDVLIDDMSRNVTQWKLQGGVGILHTSADVSLEVLQEYWECGWC